MFEVRYKGNRAKTKQYYIFREDVKSGEYLAKFEKSFYKYNPTGLFKVEEYSFGLILSLPLDASVDVPVLEINVPKTKIKISEVIDYAKSNNLYS